MLGSFKDGAKVLKRGENKIWGSLKKENWDNNVIKTE